MAENVFGISKVAGNLCGKTIAGVAKQSPSVFYT